MSSVVQLSVHLLVLTLKAPQLQHHGAALQVVQQTLGGVQRGKVNPVVQKRVDIVPHSRRVEGLAAVIEPEPEGEGKAKSSTEYRVQRTFICVTSVSIWTWHKSNLMHLVCVYHSHILCILFMPLHTAPYDSPNLDPSVAGLSDPPEATALIQDQLEVQSSTQ